MTSRRTIDLGVAGLLAISWIGCAGDESDGSAGTDAPGGPVGTWRFADGSGYVEEWVFTADGNCGMRQVGGGGDPLTITGTYAVEGDLLAREMVSPEFPNPLVRDWVTFYAGPERGSFQAYVPVGDHDGWVGTWILTDHHQTVRDDGGLEPLGGTDELIVLDEDGSFTWTTTSEGTTEEVDKIDTGTWSADDEELELVVEADGVETPWSFDTLDGAAFTHVWMERVE